MCFLKLKKRLNHLQNTVDNIYTFIKTKEYDKLKQDSSTLKEEQELLSHISFDIKDIKLVDSDTGQKILRIAYKQPIVNLIINEETNEPIKNDIFYSINRLNLTSLDDMKKVQKILKEIKNNC